MNSNQDIRIIDLTPENIADYGVCGYKDVSKHIELRRKIKWFSDYYPKGLRIKALLSEKGGYQGMIEYIPGEYAHRPVDAVDFLFIHCLFVGFKKEFKGKGFATSLIEKCIQEARDSNKKGVAVVSRKGAFMTKREIFLKNGFESVEKVKPDFELLALRFDDRSEFPSFKDMVKTLEKYQEGLYVLRSFQCPYTEKNVTAILDSARNMFDITPKLIELDDHTAAQESPCPFGTFCIVYNGEVISYHPISNTRFENIMKKIVQ
jgi:hypothetical protein